MANSLGFIARTTFGLFRRVTSTRFICPVHHTSGVVVFGGGGGGAAQIRAMRDSKGRAVKKENLPRKTCIGCGRDFVWRKKWENCWEEVTCCSKRCRSEVRSKRLNHQGEEEGQGENLVRRRGESSESKRARKKEARERKGDADAGMKACDGCNRKRDVLIRCRNDESEWQMLCGRCWREISGGGVVDGNPQSSNGYVYGGMWKNMRRDGITARMPASAKAHAAAAIEATIAFD